MSDATGKLALYITANAASFNKALSDAEKTFGNFSKKLESAGKSLTVGLTLPLVGFAAKAVSEFQDTQKALGQVEAGLRSTGGAAGFTAGELEKMAKALQGKSIFSDDQILQGVTAQMLTFTNVTGKAFEQAQQAAVDLSSRLGQDLQTSAIQLGKALNDPVKGLTSLAKVGVSFSEEQKALIKSFVESGDLASAQGVILKELNTEFGGSAQAALDASGGIVSLRNSFNDLAETVGGILAPYLSKLSEYFKGVFDSFQNLSPATQKVIVAIAGVTAAIGPVLLAAGKLSTIFSASGPLSAGITAIKVAFTALTGPVGLIVAGIAAAAALIIANWDEVKAYFTTGPGAKIFDKLGAIFTELYNVVTEIFSAIYDVVTSIWNAFGDDILSVVGSALDGLLTILGGALDAIMSIIKIFRKAFEGDWEGVWDIVKTIWMKAMNFLIQFLTDRIKDFLGIWDSVFTFFGAADFIDPAMNAIQGFADSIKFDIPDAAQTASGSIASFSDQVNKGLAKNIDQAKQLGDAINSAVAPRVDTSQIAPIQSTGTDALNIPSLTSDAQTQFQDGLMQSVGTMQALADQAQVNIDANAAMEASYIKLGETIGATFQQTSDSFKDYINNVGKALANAIRQQIKIFIAQAIAGYAAKSLATLGPVGVAIAAAAPGVIGGLFDAIIPAFASGGMVTGPQLAMVGDNPSGKEAIIPFEKMGQFLGQYGGGNGSQVIVLDARLSGNDILLSGRNTQRINERVFGKKLS